MPGFVQDNIPRTQRVGSFDMNNICLPALWFQLICQQIAKHLQSPSPPECLRCCHKTNRNCSSTYDNILWMCLWPQHNFFGTARRICMFVCCQVIEPTHLRYFVANHVNIFILAILVLTQFLSWCWERNMRQRWDKDSPHYHTLHTPLLTPKTHAHQPYAPQADFLLDLDHLLPLSARINLETWVSKYADVNNEKKTIVWLFQYNTDSKKWHQCQKPKFANQSANQRERLFSVSNWVHLCLFISLG
jgi:hypothetical protein